MIDQIPVLVIIIPLLCSVITPLLGLIRKNLCYPWVIFALAASTLCSLMLLFNVMDTGVIHYHLGNWNPPVGIEYVIDHLNAMVLVMIAATALCVAIYSRKSVEQELPGKSVFFYTVFLLQVTGMLGIVITGDMFNLYVFLEVASIAGYALIAAGEGKAPLASFRYIIMGTVGASFYLLAVGYLYIKTGSLNMADLSRILPHVIESKTIIIALAMFMIGTAIKMGLFPFHAWLPDAYTEAPTTVSSLMAPLFTKVASYVMIRLVITVFYPSIFSEIFPVTEIMTWIVFAGILYAGVMALAQTDIKRMFTYLIVAEIGYIMIGICSANKVGLTGSILHIFNDILMMACLFTALGAIYYKTGTRDVYKLTFLHRKMPITLAVFLVGALSVMGVPPFCGFFSKWYLILGAIEADKFQLVIVLLISSLISAVLFFRIIENAYIEPREEGDHHDDHDHGHVEPKAIIDMDEAPVSMLIPMVAIAVSIILFGVFSGSIVENIIDKVLPQALFLL